MHHPAPVAGQFMLLLAHLHVGGSLQLQTLVCSVIFVVIRGHFLAEETHLSCKFFQLVVRSVTSTQIVLEFFLT